MMPSPFLKLLAIALFGVVSAADAEEVLRLGLLGNKFNKSYSAGVFGFAQERQVFEQAFQKDGVKVEWSFFSAGAPALNEAIANGKVDIAIYGEVGSIAGKVGNLPTRIIAPNGMGGGKNFILVPATSNIAVPADLKGKRVALARGTAPQLLFYRWARETAGLTDKDIRMLNLGTADQETTFLSGGADVLIGSSLDLVDRGLARILSVIDADANPVFAGFGNVVVTQSYLDAHPEHVQTWIDAYVKIAAEVASERYRNDYVRLAAKTGTSAKSARTTLPKDLALAYAPIFDAYYYTRLRTAIDDCRRFGMISRDIDAAKWVEPRFLEKSLKDQGLAQRWGALRSAPGPKLAEEVAP